MKILVAYLATSGGADAVVLGARLARTLSTDLEISMILPPERDAALAATTNYESVLAKQAAAWLVEAKSLVGEDVAVTTNISYADSSAEGIIAEAERITAEAIVVGGGGGGLVGAHSLGSVVNELLHSSPIPIVLAPRGTRHSTIERVREVTCAVGGRPGADLLLSTAVRAAGAAGTPLRLVSLVALDSVGDGHKSDAAALKQARVHATETVERVKAKLPDDVTVTWSVVDGDSVEEAVNKLEWHDGDVIMVGSSRLGQARRLFLGSTAAKMLRVLQVPMVVVPREET
ncbi:Usp family protein [Gordonia effusa NBRC 100432]|uniref:Usp family protein n=1 Tax=Gordonia effusa NBRC 100432 TaxID=1077974 RepID=H0R347_9ACTN|nr:universal stress protein [Gordonia effusa]GAB19498.1 Usp family protein [Gordonia effusa NBRC 100432]